MIYPTRPTWHGRNRYLRFASDEESFAAMQADFAQFISSRLQPGDRPPAEAPDFSKDVPDLVAFAIDREGAIHAASIAFMMVERQDAEICYTASLSFLINDQQHSETLIARSIGVEAAKRCVSHFLATFADTDHGIAFEADWADSLGDAGRQFGVKFADTGLALAKKKVPRLETTNNPQMKP